MPTSPRPASPYLAAARRLGNRLRVALRPIRVLDAVRWPESVERQFLAADGRELPAITAARYRTLRFDPAHKRTELLDLERDIRSRLGRGDPLSRLLQRRCRQARAAVELLGRRGTPEFAPLARELYGSPTPADDVAVDAVFAALEAFAQSNSPASQRLLDPIETARLLSSRLRASLAGRFLVRITDDLASDAAACGRSIKLRRGARFSEADVASLEVHEGWVHLGTTRNARRQRACPFLTHGLPATTATQEGLAVLCELLAGVCHDERIRRLARRYEAVRIADDGADFIDVYRFFLTDANGPRYAYQQAARIFRGSLPAGAGPFAKDRTYALGLVRLLRAAQSARGGRIRRLQLLFSGKVAFGDLPVLDALADAGALAQPAFVPPPFRNPAALAARLQELPHPPHRLPPPVGRSGEPSRTKGAALLAPTIQQPSPLSFLDDEQPRLAG
jgi:uncharacterized protein (TIGR02421 family)